MLTPSFKESISLGTIPRNRITKTEVRNILMASEVYFQLFIQGFVPAVLPPAWGSGLLGLNYRLLGSGHTLPLLLCFPPFSPSTPPTVQPHGTILLFSPPNDAPMLLCLCTSCSSSSLFCENTLPFTHLRAHPLWKRELLYSVQDPAQLPLLFEFVPVLTSRISHSCHVWCLKGPLDSSAHPETVIPLPQLHTQICATLLPFTFPPFLHQAITKLYRFTARIFLNPPVSVSLPSPLAVTAHQDSWIAS